MKTVIVNNQEVDFDAVVNLMDDDIREATHRQFAPCTDQQFVEAYMFAHFVEFDSEFVVN